MPLSAKKKQRAVPDNEEMGVDMEVSTSTASSGFNASGTRREERRGTTGVRGRPKRKHVVRIVARRTLPDRCNHIRSLSNADGGLNTSEMSLPAEGRPDSDVPFLEPAEMLPPDDVEVGEEGVSSTSADFTKAIDFDTQGEHQYLAHQVGSVLWPLVTQNVVDFGTAASIILGAIYVPSELVCQSTPKAFTCTGSFVVDLASFVNRHEVAIDGLGTWGKPQGSSRHYKRMIGSDVADVKVLCNRYEHPGTGREGRFIRKIFTATSSTEGPLQLAVISYEWIGEPHAIQLRNVDSVEASKRPYGSRSWEAHNVDVLRDPVPEFDGNPLYTKVAIDFDAVCRIILGFEQVPPDRICSRVPQGYRSHGTFVINLTDFLSVQALRKDGTAGWGKPSGCSRYYKLNEGGATRIERNQLLPCSAAFQVQILSKRYENENFSEGRFVRKIYTGKKLGGGDAVRDYYQLAVVTYFWKGPAAPAVANDELFVFRSVPQRNVGGFFEEGDVHNKEDSRKGELASGNDAREATVDGEEVVQEEVLENSRDTPSEYPAIDTVLGEFPSEGGFTEPSRSVFPAVASSTCALDGLVLSHADHLKRLALAKETENQNRLQALLERMEQFLDRFHHVGMELGVAPAGSAEYVVSDGELWTSEGIQTVGNSITVHANRPDEVREGGSEGQYVTTDGERIAESMNTEFVPMQYQWDSSVRRSVGE